MDFLEKAIVNEITHVLISNFKKHDKITRTLRPWYGIVFPFDGEIVYTHGSKKITLSENNVVFIPKGISYDVVCKRPGAFAHINFQTANHLNVSEFVRTELKNIDSLQIEFKIMNNVFSADSAQKKCENLSSLYKIFSMLISAQNLKKTPPILDGALTYIDNNITSSALSNTQIAQSIGISEVYLRKLFSNNLSTTVNQYIQNKRIEKSMILLTKTSMTVTEISENCGYANIYYFCRSFKTKTGMTPTEFRNRNKTYL